MPPRPKTARGQKPIPTSAISRAIDDAALDSLLTSAIPGPADREFVVRCLTREGPIHHRAASYALIELLRQVAERVGATLENDPEGLSVPMRLPPHAAPLEEDEASFPLRLPRSAVAHLTDDDKHRAALEDALLDGPPHHALANVVMAALLDSILRKLGDG